MNNNMRAFWAAAFVLTAAVLMTASGPAKHDKLKLVPEACVILPVDTKMKFEWVLPPQDENIIKPADSINAGFSIDADGNLWFSRDRDTLANISKGISFRTDRKFNGFTFLDNGILFLYDDKYLGFPAKAPDSASDKAEEPEVLFQPLSMMPAEDCSVFSGEGGILYLSGKGPGDGKENAYILSGKKLTVKGENGKGEVLNYSMIFSGDRKITAIAGNGSRSYIAMGRLIMEIKEGDDETRGFFVHPQEDITSLAYSSRAGLFYATASYVGYAAGDKYMEFMKAPHARLEIRKDVLYIFMPDNYGVMKVTGISDIKKFKLKNTAR